MPFFEGEFEGEEACGVCEGVVGGGGIGVGSGGDVQHEFGPGSAFCRGGQGDDREDTGIGAESCQKEGPRGAGFQGAMNP